jgi:hypothetical protein
MTAGETFVGAIAVALLFALVIGFGYWRYTECRKVGFSFAYCVTSR